MKLIDKMTGKEAVVGNVYKSFRGEEYILKGGRPPLHDGSTGRVWVVSNNEEKFTSEYFPSVFGMEWVND